MQYKLQRQAALARWGGAVPYSQLSTSMECDLLVLPVPPVVGLPGGCYVSSCTMQHVVNSETGSEVAGGRDVTVHS